MKAPKFATMSLDALYGMRDSLEAAISKQLKAARQGLASMPGMGSMKPKRKTTRKAAGRKAATRKAAPRKVAAKTAARGTKRAPAKARKRA